MNRIWVSLPEPDRVDEDAPDPDQVDDGPAVTGTRTGSQTVGGWWVSPPDAETRTGRQGMVARPVAEEDGAAE